jgi:hypothetical protein
MVDFKKRLSGKKTEAVIDPLRLYETLDRAHDKGPLRPAQTAVLDEWFRTRRAERYISLRRPNGTAAGAPRYAGGRDRAALRVGPGRNLLDSVCRGIYLGPHKSHRSSVSWWRIGRIV